MQKKKKKTLIKNIKMDLKKKKLLFINEYFIIID